MAPRRPTRLLEYANKSSAYPRELLANLDSGELTLIDNNGNEVATNPLSTETSGTGNAVKEITVNGRKIIITKATYLTEHPTITTSADGTDTAANPGFGGTFNVVSTVTRDGNGHVTQIKTKTVTMPSAQTSVTGNAGTADKLKTARTIALSGDVTGSVSFDGSVNKTISATLANSGVTANSYGPSANSSPAHGESFVIPEITVDAKGRVTSATERTITLPSAASSVTGNAGTADKLKTARTISLNGGATGSTTFDGSADATINVTALDGSKITGTIPLSSIPKGAQERMVPVANMTAMLALTSSDVQNGDVVKVTETGLMYYVADETRLGTEAAFSVFTAGAASSVPWTGVTNKPTFASVATTGSYNDLSNKPTIPSAGTSTPKAASTNGSAGSASTYSKSDHSHPAQTSVSGNAGSATKLANARNIALTGDVSGSASFNGEADASISATLAASGVTAGSYGPSANASPAHSGTFTVPQVTVDAKGRVTSAASRTITLPAAPTSISGNAGTADKLKTARSISLSGDVSGSTTFDGSGDKSISATLANSGVTAGDYGPSANKAPGGSGTFSVPQVTVDAKGRVTSAINRTITMPAVPDVSTYVHVGSETEMTDPVGGTALTTLDIADNLTSTNTDKALSANQGKVLSDRVTSVESTANAASNGLRNKLNISGGTMTGKLIAQNNTDYTVKQVRNIFISTSAPTSSDGDNGDIWLVYKA